MIESIFMLYFVFFLVDMKFTMSNTNRIVNLEK